MTPSTTQVLTVTISEADHRYLRERAEGLRLSLAGVIRQLIQHDRRGPSEHEKLANPSHLDAKLRGKVFGLAMRGVQHQDGEYGRLAIVDANALEELFGVFCAITGTQPSELRPMTDEEKKAAGVPVG